MLMIKRMFSLYLREQSINFFLLI